MSGLGTSPRRTQNFGAGPAPRDLKNQESSPKDDGNPTGRAEFIEGLLLLRQTLPHPHLPPKVMNEDGQTSTIRDKILTIDVRPGWRQGTRITFEKEGDQVTAVRGSDRSPRAEKCCCAQEHSKKMIKKSPFWPFFLSVNFFFVSDFSFG